MAKILALLLLLSATIEAFAQQVEYDTVTVATYNLLRFGGTSNSRLDELRLILDEIRPDILLIQEIASPEGYNLFQDSVAFMLDVPLVGTGFEPGIHQQDSYVAIYYNPSIYGLRNTSMIVDTPRVQLAATLEHYESGDSILVISAHWRADDTPADEAMREENGIVGRRYLTEVLPVVSGIDNVIYGGDLNVYESDEPGYQQIIKEGGNGGILNDPIDRPGDWHNDVEFAEIHTQSTRTRQFGGGANGGIDDRFDQILLSGSLDSSFYGYIEGSYRTFGHSGEVFNDSINSPDNSTVTPAVAQALHDASDHLPVVLSLLYPRTLTGVREDEEGLEIDLVIGED